MLNGTYRSDDTCHAMGVAYLGIVMKMDNTRGSSCRPADMVCKRFHLVLLSKKLGQLQTDFDAHIVLHINQFK